MPNKRKGTFDMKNRLSMVTVFILTLVTYLPTLQWMVNRWFAEESYYGHGFLIPMVSLYILWQRRELFKNTQASKDMLGLIIIAMGLFVHLVCASLRVYSISGFSFVFVLYGIVVFFYGRKVARGLTFPIFFLFAMIPLPLVLIGNLTVKLKLLVAQVATVILNNIGFPSIRDGSVIKMPNSFIFVEAPCSGLRSLISLLTLGLVFSYAMKVSYIKKGILFYHQSPLQC